MQKERYKKFLLTIKSSPVSNYRSTKRKCLIKTRLTFSILSEQVSPVKKSNRLVCILTSRELSSVDVTGAGGGMAGFTNIETGRIRAATIDGAVEGRVVTGVPFEKPTWFRVHLCLGKS